MIIFVGDKPSNKNKDPKVPFVGTKSYKVLLDWIYDLDINVTDVVTCNKEHLIIYSKEFKAVELPHYFMDILEDDSIIALGNEAAKRLNELGLDHFKLPHPSPKNRILNDKKKIKDLLKECKEWLKKK